MSHLELFDSLLQTIQTARSLSMRGEHSASLYQLEEASRALRTLCNRLAHNSEDKMSLEQQSKRRRTGSKAADNDSSPGSPNANVSPATTQRAPSVAQSVSVTHSPAVVSQKPQYYQDSTSINPALQYSYEAQQHQQYQAPQQQYAQQDQQQQQQSSYHQQYTTQQDHQRIADFDTQSNPSSIYSVGSSAAAAAVAAAAAAAVSTPSSALAQPQPRILTSNISMQQPGQQQISIASLSASVSTPASVTTASTATSVTTPHTTMQQPFVSSHALPTSFLGQSPAVASTDYSMLLYQHQHMPSADRSVAVTAGVSGVVSSTSVSPISQHALASADQQYSSIHGQLDGQMRYMAVPGQPSGMPKPLAAGPSAGMPMDRSFRQNPISAQQQQQHGFVAMQYHQAQQHQQHHYSHHYGQHHQQSAFTAQPPATASAAAVAAVMSEGRAGQAQMGSASGSSSMHAGGYHAVHSAGAGSQMAPSQVSAAQVAAAVAAAASAHTIPVVSSGTSSGVVSGGIEQHGLSALKLPIVTQTGGEPSMPDYLDDYTQSYMVGGQSIMEPNSASPTEQTLDADLINRLNELFMKYLEQICSNNITVDSEGESIHQTQMAKKLEKLEQCTEYRTFRFRIQAFSNAYREFIEKEAGMTEQVVSKQQLRNYLHQQKYISRYNEDGKKAKSKGHHVWNVEAKKISRNSWWFKEFNRRIASPPPKAVVGVPYEWTPTIWDPQIRAPKVYFNSDWLPPWLRWENNSLRGIPPADATDCNITVTASYYQGKEVRHLKTPFTLHVVPHSSSSMFMP